MYEDFKILNAISKNEQHICLKGMVTMSTREIAYSIFEQLSENELQGFIALFSKAYPPKNDETTRKYAAFESLKRLCRYIPDLDEQTELAQKREVIL